MAGAPKPDCPKPLGFAGVDEGVVDAADGAEDCPKPDDWPKPELPKAAGVAVEVWPKPLPKALALVGVAEGVVEVWPKADVVGPDAPNADTGLTGVEEGVVDCGPKPANPVAPDEAPKAAGAAPKAGVED